MENPTSQYNETSQPAKRHFNTKYLMLFFVSLVACILFLIFLPQFFWITLPFVCTFLVQAFDAL